MSADHPSPLSALSARTALVLFRRAALGSLAVGGAAALVLALLGRPLLGLCALVGVALGAANGYLAHRSLRALASRDGEVPRKRVAVSSLSRLAAVTAVALTVGIAARPDGLAVFFGLAFFQIAATASALLPHLEEARKP